jgi:hypothetical protein
MMLEVVIGVVVVLLMVAGILVMLGPTTGVLIRRARNIRGARVPSVFQAAMPREVGPAGINPTSQRVLEAAARLGNWLRAHGHSDLYREVRHAAVRINSNEAAGLYAMQTVLRKVRSLTFDERIVEERLKTLTNELMKAVQDRFEQLELLPFRKP